MILHAGCLALRIGGVWRGVLLTGASGAGKSDLALRLLSDGWRLVADDRVLLWTSANGLFARAPATLHGLMEVRGLDVVARPALPACRVGLHAQCDGETERMPEPAETAWLGVRVPRVSLDALHASAPAKLHAALFAAVRRRPLESSGLGRI